MQEALRASSSAGQSWRLITAWSYRPALPKHPHIRRFLAVITAKKCFHLLFTYEGHPNAPSQVQLHLHTGQ